MIKSNSIQYFIKRFLDYSVSIFLLLILSPVFLLFGVLLCFSNFDVFFTQLRPGRNGKIFKIIKLKTMNNKRGIDGSLLPDSKRLTKLGKIIRKLSLDELPQILNILKGDMSFVGPRPLLVEYLPLYSIEQHRRHDVLPGITGLAQVNGRNAISWEEKFLYDIYYVDNWTLWLDFKIIMLTIKKVFMRSGIESQTCATMEPFKGSKEYLNE